MYLDPILNDYLEASAYTLDCLEFMHMLFPTSVILLCSPPCCSAFVSMLALLGMLDACDLCC